MDTKVLKSINHTYSYEDYKKLVINFAEESNTSGEQSEERIAATSINAQRIKRIDKQCIINNDLQELISKITAKQHWLIITESWCGDGAQCIPVIAKIAALNSNIKLELVFRDEHLDLIDCFLTNGSRSIPKLICKDESTDKINFVWGPRPKTIQDKVLELKKDNPKIAHDELVKNIHLWYAQDKTQSIQSEFTDLLNKINLE
ncbi:MAG: thioredoxin family protein [Bacteroidetes bacterium]|jgi:hypothetical protein|nr:thioredoxin family protein [Bacteroidota bacterium]